MVIWKWPLEMIDHQILEMPIGAKILDVQMQGETCCLWAMCDPYAAKENRSFTIRGTGQTMPDNPGKYIATFQYSYTLVFHIFEDN